jgi:hypothetical protein
LEAKSQGVQIVPLIKRCEYCGSEFKVKPSRFDKKKFCSKDCHNNSMKKEISKVCERCGKEFKGVPSAIKNQKHCSVECKNISMNESIPYDTIYDIYVNKRMTTREAGKALGVSKRKIADTLRYYNIPIRDHVTQRKGDNYKKPSKDILSTLYFDKYMSLEDISKIYDVDLSTVGLWLKEYNLKARIFGEGRRKKDFVMPTKAQLEDLYIKKQMSTLELSKIFKCSKGLITKILKDYGIELRPALYKKREYAVCKDGHVVRSGLERIVDDFLFENNFEHEYEKRLPKPYYRYRSDFYCNGYYIEIWGVTGNKEYNKRRKLKEQAYSDLGLKLISIEASDFTDNTVFQKLSQIS